MNVSAAKWQHTILCGEPFLDAKGSPIDALRSNAPSLSCNPRGKLGAKALSGPSADFYRLYPH
jgi:hypothetical protein